MALSFSSAVEQWRAAVAALVAEFGLSSDLIDKVLYTIQGESGGDPYAYNSSGATGLLQIISNENPALPNRPSREQLQDPMFNLRYAFTQLGIAQGSFAAWGEENTYNGQPFGALGLNPYPGNASAAGVTGISPSKPPEWINNASWIGGGAWRDPQSGKYWDEAIKDWIVAPRSIIAPVPSTGITPPAAQPAPVTTAPVPKQNIPVFPVAVPSFTLPANPYTPPAPAQTGISTSLPAPSITPAPMTTPAYAGIPQSMLSPGQWNEVTIGAGGVPVNSLQGWTAWEQLSNGNWQQWGPNEYIPSGSRVGLLPAGMSLDKGRNPRPS